MAIINIEYNDKLQVVSKFGEKINQYSKNTDTISVKFDYNFKSSVPAVYLYAERNDRENNNLASTQLFYNSETNAFEYTLGSNDGDPNTSWYTAIPGPIKLAFRIVDNEAVITTDVYKLWINASNMPGNEEVTLNADQFNNIVNYYQSIADLKLNISDEKVKLLELTFNTENDFALEVLKETEEIGAPRIYLANIATSAADKRNVVGICQKASGGNYVLILEGNGSIKVSNGLTLSPVKFSYLQADLFSLTNGTATNLTILQTLNATNASVTLPNAEPLNANHAVPKFYVDDIKTELQEKIDGIEAAQNLLDIVKDYQELDEYEDKHLLQVNDKIKVLQDENYGNAGTYYKWNGTAWVYIGKDGIYYTQTEVDTIKNNLQAQIDSLKTLINTLTSSNVSYKEE